MIEGQQVRSHSELMRELNRLLNLIFANPAEKKEEVKKP